MKVRRRAFATGSFTALACVAVVRGAAPAAQFQYKLGHDFPTSHPYDVAARRFAAAVERESGGRIEVQVFPDNALGSDPAMFEQLRAGALQINFQASLISSIIPVAGIMLVGFCFDDRRQALAAMEGAVGEIIRRELDAKGIVAFQHVWEAGFRQVTNSSRPVQSADDLAGLKLRIPTSTISVDMWKTLGASPVPLSVADLYPALQTHLVDGCDGAFVTFLSQKIYEVQRYLSVTNHQWSCTWFLMNGDAYKALPPDLQTIFRRNAEASGVNETRMAAEQNNEAAKTLATRLRINQSDNASFRSRLSAYYQRWKSEFGPTAWAALEQYTGKLT